tara:strand:+ start:89 stop:457 length:369 start_codon:yes stop_codon:yes gene_type:complete
VSNYFYFIIITVLLNALSQILLKKGMNNIGTIEISFKSFLKSIDIIFLNPFIIIGLIFMVTSMFTHLISLSKFELSFAFPFISLSYVIVFIAGYFLFSENINLTRLIAMLLIILGTVFLAKS